MQEEGCCTCYTVLGSFAILRHKRQMKPRIHTDLSNVNTGGKKMQNVHCCILSISVSYLFNQIDYRTK